MERPSIGTRMKPALLSAVALFASFGLIAPTAHAVEEETPVEESPAVVESVVQVGDGEGVINVDYASEGNPLADVTFHLYNLAVWNPSGGYTPAGDFADSEKYPVNWDVLNLSEDGYRNFANTIAGYIAQNNTAALATAQSDAEGKLQFTGVGDGLFLVTADPVQEITLQCTSSAMLVALPNVHVQSGEDQRIVTIKPKTDCLVPELTNVTVKKVWDDFNNPSRPQSITVELLRNNESYEEIQLSADNNWTYTWQNLAGEDDWKVIEKEVPAGYSTISAYDTTDVDQKVVTITNSKPEEPKPTPPAQTGAEIVTICAIALSALAIGVLLIVKTKREQA